MLSAKLAKTPCAPNLRLVPAEGSLFANPHVYRGMVGSLHYLTFTRLDLSFAVHQVCQFMFAPNETHLIAAKRILRYINGTPNFGVFFQCGQLSLSAFSDLEWVGDLFYRKSTIGYLVYLGYNPITWNAKKQDTMSRSSTESKYRAFATTAAELCWIRQVLKDLGIFLSFPPKLSCDNISALAIASNPVFHARTNHVQVDYHFFRDRVLHRDLQIRYITTGDQLANIFTKSLSSSRFQFLRSKTMVSIDPLVLRGDVSGTNENKNEEERLDTIPMVTSSTVT